MGGIPSKYSSSYNNIVNMKKFIITLSFALLGICSAFAIKAHSGSIARLTLADGTEVSATLQGDEHFHYYTLLDGTPLLKNANGSYKKATQEEWEDWRAKVSAVNSRATGIGRTFPNYFPHTGSPKALVILVQFQDVKFKSPDPKATFNHYLNAEMGEPSPEDDATVFRPEEGNNNYGSVREYFKETSLGQFTPQFDVVGPVTVSQKSAYYGEDSGDETDVNEDQMISEACGLVANKVDFSEYDNDNDGYADLVYIIYAGYSQSWSPNPDEYLWPKCGAYYFYQYDFDKKKLTNQQLAYNNTKICRFGINNELNVTPENVNGGLHYLNGIGTFCHEFSHAMGLPDLYDSNYKGKDNQSPEYWDVMDMGSYLNLGYCPTPYSPWEKMMMGWVSPETLSKDHAAQITLEPYDENSKSYKIEADVDDNNFFVNENYSPTIGEMENGELSSQAKAKLKERAKGEYLLLQNIQNKGWYQSLPGYGLLVWRIDYSDNNKVNLGDAPNDVIGIPRVMIVPADGLVINQSNTGTNKKYTVVEYMQSMVNDPFPAYQSLGCSTDVDSLTSVKLNWSTLTTRPLYNIQKDEATGMVTFDYLKDFKAATGIKDAIIEETGNHRPTQYFDLEGRRVNFPQKGHLYITDKGKKIVF